MTRKKIQIYSVSSAAQLPLILALDRVDLRHALAVALLAYLGRQPRSDNLPHLLAVDRLASKRQHICIVVLARVARNINRITRGRAHARDLVRRHRTPDTRAVNHDSEIRTTIGHRARDRMREVR